LRVIRKDWPLNWSALGAIAQLLSAVAVVVSLLYVAAQVKVSTRQARQAAGRDLAARVSDVSLAVAADPELGRLLVQGGADPGVLSPGDQARFRGLMNTLFRGFEQQYQLRREGALDDEAWGAVERMIRDWMALPGVQVYFRDRGDWYTTGFLEYVRQAAGGTLVREAKRSLLDHYGEGAR
jgi:hypothetical protein